MYKIYIGILLVIICSILLLRKYKKNLNEYYSSLYSISKEIDNTSILVFPDKWTSDFRHRFKKHEPYTNLKLKELLQYLPNNSYIIDVGSHVGDTGLYLAKILKNFYSKKNIKVIMIDPEKTKIEFIKEMAKVNKLNNIITYQRGISNEVGVGDLDKKLHPGAWKIKKGKDWGLKLDTLDNICKGKNISLLHIDVEGMEYQCLLGSSKILKKIKYIMIELNGIQNTRKKEIDFLYKNNFYKIPNEKIEKENGNVLFEKK